MLVDKPQHIRMMEIENVGAIEEELEFKAGFLKKKNFQVPF